MFNYKSFPSVLPPKTFLHYSAGVMHLMEVFHIFATVSLFRDLVTSTKTLENSTDSPTVHPNQTDDVDSRCHGKFSPRGFWDATCQLNGSLGPPAPLVFFDSL